MYKRVNIRRSMDSNRLLVAQMFINEMLSLYLGRDRERKYHVRLPFTANSLFIDKLKKIGHRSSHRYITLQCEGAKKSEDKKIRHGCDILAAASLSQPQVSTLLGKIVVPNSVEVPSEVIRSTMTEALRDYTTVRAKQLPSERWAMVPLFNESDFPYFYTSQ